MSWKVWNGVKLGLMTNEAVGEAVYDTADEIGALADQQVPHDEGTLQASKTIKGSPDNPRRVKIGYGGGAGTGWPPIPYAVKWHETPANFQKGRKHNYLKDPLFIVGPKALKRNLKKAGQKTWR